jgi:hypothetical protein
MKTHDVKRIVLCCLLALTGAFALRFKAQATETRLTHSEQRRRASLVTLHNLCSSWMTQVAVNQEQRMFQQQRVVETLPSFPLQCVRPSDRGQAGLLLKQLADPQASSWDAALAKRDALIAQQLGAWSERGQL